MEIVEAKPGETILLLGNEAITRGAIEAGVDFATTYPGTPSSEIADTFSAIARYLKSKGREVPFYFEYSTNEKVALEVAAAAAFCGLRALTCMKHVGLNVASDAFMTYMYVGCKGGHIIVTADDPYCHSSQNEQDNRYYALFGNAPMLEPSTPQEAKDMTLEGFDISEKLHLPLLLRTTTRTSHVRGPVKIGKCKQPRKKGYFEKDPMMVTVPVTARARHPVLLERMREAEKLSEKSRFNEVIEKGGGLGIIASGVSVMYALDAIDVLKIDADILKLGFTNPLPKEKCKRFIEEHKEIIVLEELEPILEERLKIIAFDAGVKVKIYGKSTGHFSRLYEYNPDIVIEQLCKILDIENPLPKPKTSNIKLPSRPPVMCPGCPHRASYYAAKKASPKEIVYPTDIGCYTLGKSPPLEMADVLLCMGSNAGIACGLSKATDQKVISFMGDSTFFHAALPAIVDAVHHNLDCVITVLDNRTTAMTGHQPHPGTSITGMGEKAKALLVEDVVRGLGVEHVEVTDPRNLNETTEAFKRALEFRGPSVVVCKSPCILLELREKRKKGEKIDLYEVNQDKCRHCNICILKFGCPAFYFDSDGNVRINEELCTGCGVCKQVCPFGAIEIKGEKR
ncbi:MAG TPA: indolepyruvate ferredoxin oxidoreductase subunit alpha [Thermoplasmatales archaeon]|nr:indolepyruvate ferredoxin oxidoreductase subunit alpha [Thermoplasmatales archaeon]